MNGYYQPAGLIGRVTWTWLLMLPMFGTIMWLEATKVTPYTIVSYLVFIILVVWLFVRRKASLTKGQLRLYQLFGLHTERLDLADIRHLQVNRHQVLFTVDGENYNYWLSPKLADAFIKAVERETMTVEQEA